MPRTTHSATALFVLVLSLLELPIACGGRSETPIASRGSSAGGQSGNAGSSATTVNAGGKEGSGGSMASGGSGMSSGGQQGIAGTSTGQAGSQGLAGQAGSVGLAGQGNPTAGGAGHVGVGGQVSTAGHQATAGNTSAGNGGIADTGCVDVGCGMGEGCCHDPCQAGETCGCAATPFGGGGARDCECVEGAVYCCNNPEGAGGGCSVPLTCAAAGSFLACVDCCQAAQSDDFYFLETGDELECLCGPQACGGVCGTFCSEPQLGTPYDEPCGVCLAERVGGCGPSLDPPQCLLACNFLFEQGGAAGGAGGMGGAGTAGGSP